MGLLDELKKEAALVRAAETLPPIAIRHADLSAAAIPALFRIHRCLRELIDQLQVLQREVPATIRVAGIGDIGGFIQESYTVSTDQPAPTVVTFRCSLRYAKRVPIDVKTSGSLNLWLENARRQGLMLKVLRASEPNALQQRAFVSVEAPVSATLQFQLDPEVGAVQLFSRNFDELGERRQFFNPAQVTNEWADELIKFLMRHPHRFMMHEVASDTREYLRRRLEWEKLKRDAEPAAAEMHAGRSMRLKKLFSKTASIKLHYAGRDLDVDFIKGPFILGRVTECDLQVRDQRVSRFHARLEARDGQVVLVDDSTNGTHVQFADGRVERLLRSECVLEGRGLIALGSLPSEFNLHAVRFDV